MKRKPRYLLLSAIFFINLSIGAAHAQQAGAPAFIANAFAGYGERPERDRQDQILERSRSRAKESQQIVFRHGDLSWLPALATEAGWPERTHGMLAKIIMRESGGCPNRRGGDVVDENCNITGVSEWNHRSDTGLLQINGVNYDTDRNKWARICLDMNICEQEPLLDPLTNLKAGYVLFKVSGWDPWDPCAWGAAYAKRCKANKGG